VRGNRVAARVVARGWPGPLRRARRAVQQHTDQPEMGGGRDAVHVATLTLHVRLVPVVGWGNPTTGECNLSPNGEACVQW